MTRLQREMSQPKHGFRRGSETMSETMPFRPFRNQAKPCRNQLETVPKPTRNHRLAHELKPPKPVSKAPVRGFGWGGSDLYDGKEQEWRCRTYCSGGCAMNVFPPDDLITLHSPITARSGTSTARSGGMQLFAFDFRRSAGPRCGHNPLVNSSLAAEVTADNNALSAVAIDIRNLRLI
jgi:hypothetical protein